MWNNIYVKQGESIHVNCVTLEPLHSISLRHPMKMVYSSLNHAYSDNESGSNARKRILIVSSIMKGLIRSWCLSATITITAVSRICTVGIIWTNARCLVTVDLASSTTKGHFTYARLHQVVNWMWLSRLVPIERSTVLRVVGMCCLHHVEPLQWTMWTACSLHWKDISNIATGFN